MNDKKGRISSFQTLGTLDGPGVRFIAFLQGCPLKCGCCHNPESQGFEGGTQYTAEDIVEKAMRFKEYFGSEGGITLSGGEPLLQAEFCTEVFKLCKEKGITTCLDTSGCILNSSVLKLLEYTDYCLLDIKYTDNNKYLKYVGCDYGKPIEFLEELNALGIKTFIRQVIIEGLNTDKQNIENIAELIKRYPIIEKYEPLAFRKLCVSKYKSLGMEFPFNDIPETKPSKIKEIENRVSELTKR